MAPIFINRAVRRGPTPRARPRPTSPPSGWYAHADVAAPKLATAITRAFAWMREGTDMPMLVQACANHDPAAALRALHVEALPQHLSQSITPVISELGRKVFRQAAQQTLGATVSKADGEPSLDAEGGLLDQIDQYGADAAEGLVGNLVTAIDADTLEALQTAIHDSLAYGLTANETARLIRSRIGLNDQQAGAVESYRQRLLAAGNSQARTLDLVGRYTDRLLNERTYLITRTETIRASTDAQQAWWDYAQQQGIMSPEDFDVIWISTPDAHECATCDGLDGTRVAYGESFDTPDGSVDGPPAHPACRCTINLISKGSDLGKREFDLAAWAERVLKGEAEGHGFRGNQYTGGIPEVEHYHLDLDAKSGEASLFSHSHRMSGTHSHAAVAESVITSDSMPDRATAEQALRNFQATQKGDLPGHEFHGNQWTGGMGGMATVGGAQRMVAALKEHGGFTAVPQSGESPKSGFQVGIKGFTQIVPDQQSDTELARSLVGYIDQHAEQWRNPDNYIGGWHDTEHHEVVFDVSRHVEDRASAVRLGIAQDQQSIWDNAHGEEINTGGTGQRTEAAGAGAPAGELGPNVGVGKASLGAADGQAREGRELVKGEAQGHDFRGNQHTGGISGGGLEGTSLSSHVRDRLQRGLDGFRKAGGKLQALSARQARALAASLPDEHKLKSTLAGAYDRAAVVHDSNGNLVGALSYDKNGSAINLHELWTTPEAPQGTGISLVVQAASEATRGGDMTVMNSVNDPYWSALGGDQPANMRTFFWSPQQVSEIKALAAVTKGDVAGHDFHGNQYTGGIPGAVGLAGKLGLKNEMEAYAYLNRPQPSGLTVDERERLLQQARSIGALRDYQGQGYGTLNAYLRGEIDPKDFPQAQPEFYQGLKDQTENIDKAMEPSVENQEVYRALGELGTDKILGTRDRSDAAVEAKLNGLVGSTISDKGFVSTSEDKQVVGAKVHLSPILFEIGVPKGTPEVNFQRYVGIGDPKFAYEREVLLEHGQDFKVDGWRKTGTQEFGTEYPVHVVHLSVQPGASASKAEPKRSTPSGDRMVWDDGFEITPPVRKVIKRERFQT